MGDLATSGLLVFNGEIYNYLELRAELEELGEQFLSRSDTEVLLKALCRWGPEQTVQRLNGMWAFAWLEPGGSRLWLSRDRAGEKPLYWHCGEGGLYFSSEVKALLTLAGRRFALNLQVVGQFLLQSLVDTGLGSLFSGIEQVPAASLGVVDLSRDPPVPSFKGYWEPRSTEEGAPPELDSRIEILRETFLDAVRLRLRSDVPVGILLSGGVDSSAIAAAAHRLVPSDAPLNLLSAVSGQAQFDESPFIERVARHLGRPVTRVSLDEDVGSGRLFGEIESAIWHNDAPIGSLSNVMHRRLMAAARKHGITVVLSGQGADELLCGYKKYLGFHLQHLVRSGRYRDAVATAWRFWRNGTVIAQFRLAEAKRYLPWWLRRAQGDLRGPALAGYRPLGLGLPPGADVRARQVADLQALSIPVLTHFEDRMSMAESREVRLPFLDPRLMEMLISMPTELKLRDGWTKYVMRKAIEPWLPPEIVWRKDKQGFVNPEAEWLKRELRDQVLSYFAPDALLFRFGLVDRRALLSRYNAYARQPPGRGAVWFRDIFNPLALEIWLRRFEPFISQP
jgi:asparagine synthase (glutamine-hydrolysing)